jgi:hypothetical protein
MEIRDPQLFVAYLDGIHARTRRVIACVPADALEWAPAEGRFSFGDVIRHLAGIERWLYAETVQGRPNRYAGPGTRHRHGHRPPTRRYSDTLRRHLPSRHCHCPVGPV